MAFTDVLQNLMQGNTQDATDTDAQEQSDNTTNPSDSITKESILQKFYEMSGKTNLPQSLGDRSGQTGDLGEQAYFPTENNNPEQLKITPGGGSLPFTGIVTGGSPLYPFGVRDARKKAIADAAYSQALMYQNNLSKVKDKYQKLSTYAPYQQQLNQNVDDLVSQESDYISKHGASGINELNDPTSDISKELDDKYYTLVAQGKAVQDASTYATYLQKQQADGKYVSPATQQSLQDFREGDFKMEAVPQVFGKMSAYASLDNVLKGSDATTAPDAVRNFVTNITDSKGNKLNLATDKEKIIAIAKQKYYTDDRLNDLVENFRDLHPEYSSIPDKTIKDYYKVNGKQTIETDIRNLENFEPESEKDAKKIITVPAEQNTTLRTGTRSIANGSVAVDNTPTANWWDLSKTNNFPKDITFKVPDQMRDLERDSVYTGGAGVMTGDIPAVGDFYVDAHNKIVDNPTADTKTKRFAVVTVKQPKDALGNAAADKQYLVPFENVQQQLDNAKVKLGGTSQTQPTNVTAQQQASQYLISKNQDASAGSVSEFLNKNVLVTSPNGQQGYIPTSQLQDAIKKGYKQAQ